jgi:Mrp family chromosome partitioning ATPase
MDPEQTAADKEGSQGIEKLATNPLSNIKHVLAIMSGKGGVGKSSVTSLLAVEAARRGYKIGILDADITGPSIPKMFGMTKRPDATEMGLLCPATDKLGIRIMSLNLLLEQEDTPVIWRGPLIAGAVRQFWTDVVWGDLDVLLVDLPPGTGDSPLTIMQSLPLDGVVIVTSPQALAGMVVRKAARMASMMDVPILGVVENMSYLSCPHCGEKIAAFGQAGGSRFARSIGAPLLGSLQLDPGFAAACDEGKIEDYEGPVKLDLTGISVFW